MSLASHAFILLFLPLTLFLYYRLFKTPRIKMFFLLAMSALFYALAGWKFLPVLAVLSFFTHWSGRRGWILPGVIVNLGALALFKYWNFGVENFNLLMKTLHLGFAVGLLSLGLPLGISFFVFKHIGYLLDIQAKRYPASGDIWAFMTFSAYFPQISAGPISSYKDTAGQFSRLPERLDNSQAVSGLVQLSFGLVKKVLIADQIGQLLSSPLNTVNGFAGFIPAWYLLIAFAAQLYFDFSGYTDMVLGVSTLFGIKLPPNFNNPYLARNPADFWGRWHISLSMWFRYYVFSPLSRSLLTTWGSAHRELAQYAANLLTMSLVGLWHGAGWGYVLWGAYHGFLLNLGAWWNRSGRDTPSWATRSAFLLSILLGWALFMSPSLPYLRHLLAGLVYWHGLGDMALIKSLWQDNASLALLAGIPLAFSGFAEAAALLADRRGVGKWQLLTWGVLVAISLILIQKQISFFYVRF
jgi:alginate O-acetyltransferase complex protein AlgI